MRRSGLLVLVIAVAALAVPPALARDAVLIKDGAVKTGWLAAICEIGEVNGLAPGLFGSAGPQLGSLDGHLRRACATGPATSVVTAEDTR